MTLCKNPVLRLVAYEDRFPDFIFVAVPNRRGRYIRTHKAVALFPCPVCHSVVGEPCKGNQTDDGYTSSIHCDRSSQLWGNGKPYRSIRDVVDKPRVRYVKP